MAFIGKALRPLRAGTKKLAILDPSFADAPRLEIGSVAFSDGGPMGSPFTGSEGVSPPLRWSGVPPGTKSIAIVVQDVDVPLPAPLVHALAYAIAPETFELPAAALPRADARESAASVTLGRGVAGEAYAPPTPIPGHGPHRYVFQVFALDFMPAFAAAPDEKQLVEAMRGHVTACGSVTGTHEAL